MRREAWGASAKRIAPASLSGGLCFASPPTWLFSFLAVNPNRYEMSRKAKIPTEQLSEDTKKLIEVLNNEADLSVILIATSFLDSCLKSILENKLIESTVTDKLLWHTGALGNLSARADLCYVLGLISKKWYRDLCTFGEIRNLVAHDHLQQSFQTPEIASKCMNLSTQSFSFQGERLSPRDYFTTSAVLLANWLLITALQIKKEPKIKSPKEPNVVKLGSIAPGSR